MKRVLSKTIALFAICMTILLASHAQVLIKVRPGPPVERVRPGRPGPNHIWVNGTYMWRRDQYVYSEGYWAVPPPGFHHWKPGHWKKIRGGWVWIPGHWR